jgi:hypothetical protein
LTERRIRSDTTCSDFDRVSVFADYPCALNKASSAAAARRPSTDANVAAAAAATADEKELNF